MTENPAAVRLHPAWDDPDAVLALIRRAGPYLPLARYAASDSEKRATGGVGGTFVPPWFRIDVATEGRVHVPGGEVLLHNPHFVDAAGAVFGGVSVVEPTTVYVNVMGPCDYPFVAHTDIPVFRGRTKANTPVWLLQVMHSSRLFETERISLATAVSWFFSGPGGDFHYWPDGPDADSVVERAPFDNVAIVADNEFTYHGVAPVGLDGAPSPFDLTLDAEIVHDDRGWTVTDGDREVISYDDATVRITTSWKAEVYADAGARDLARSGEADLTIDEVTARFADELAIAPPADPLVDDAWVATLAEAFPRPHPRILSDG